MLKEIFCDKFISHGKVRQAIQFHQGLNTVLGSTTGSNSIGKSTFLMIIDFVFGGMDYIGKSADIHANVGGHTICFAFEFENAIFHFSRATDTPQNVNICDNNYNITGSITLDSYNKWLKEKYGLKDLAISFRAIVGKFFRVYLRECCDECHPLKSADRAPDKDGIFELLKLYDKYSVVENLTKSFNDMDNKHKALRKAIKFSHIVSPANNREYKRNNAEIEKLGKELEEFLAKSNDGLLDLDSAKAIAITNIRSRLSKLYRQRIRLKAKKAALSEENLKVPITKDFSDLQQYFPTVNVKKLAEVEVFHAEVINVLKEEYKNSCEEIELLLNVCENEIKVLENEIATIDCVPNVSQIVLKSYATTKQKYDYLVNANKNYDMEKKLAKNVADLNMQIKNLLTDELKKIELELNSFMEYLNKAVFSKARTAPIINFQDENRYNFLIPNDNGTGSRYKGLIFFDLAILEKTKVPVLAHDSFMLKQIEDHVLEKLFELYSKTSKQIFIAIDKHDSYTKRAEAILESTVILKLAADGNELFGLSWNMINNKKI